MRENSMRITDSSSRPAVLRLACLLVASLSAGCSVDEAPLPASAEIDVKRYELTGEYD
jgi:hypothetical protein